MDIHHRSSRLTSRGAARSRLVLLAPLQLNHPFSQILADGVRYQKLLSEAQQLRGRIYLQDSAIQPWEVSASGRYIQASDKASWHVLTVDENERVTGCVRYFQHHKEVVFSELGLSKSAIANSVEWAPLVRDAVQAQISSAARRRFSYVELGGWALSHELRYSAAALRMILSVYALASVTGNALAVTTAIRFSGS